MGRTKRHSQTLTGFGGLLNVDLAVRGYEIAGAAAIQIEDQEFPKKCGHTPDAEWFHWRTGSEDQVARDARESIS